MHIFNTLWYNCILKIRKWKCISGYMNKIGVLINVAFIHAFIQYFYLTFKNDF